MNDCGSCAFFQKAKQMQNNSGLCEYYDCRTNTGSGHGCEEWKGIKYRRVRRVNYAKRS